MSRMRIHSFELYEYIGKRICEARQEAGLNKSELAQRIDKSPATISRWENGEATNIGIYNLYDVAAALGVADMMTLLPELKHVLKRN